MEPVHTTWFQWGVCLKGRFEGSGTSGKTVERQNQFSFKYIVVTTTTDVACKRKFLKPIHVRKKDFGG